MVSTAQPSNRLDDAGAELFLELRNVEHADTLGQWFTLDPKGLATAAARHQY
jgi:hypothetical protein